ncbi:MAG TPA: hypothetical protein PLF81_06710 [Candidatus Anammoximicrobium sp.]|nr:hypothetical protein [Candidatus Anammoximicrobium sp.]
MSIMRDLENLLREIAEQQQGQPRPAPPRPAPPRPAAQRAPQPRPAPQRPLASRSAPVDAEVLDAEIVDAAPVRRRAAVAQHVEKHLDTSDVTVHAAQLGAEIGQADEKVEAHLHQKFDHDLSRISDPEDKAGAAAGAAFAARIVELFRSPQSIQQAFILNEIINRPEQRW